MGSLPIQPPAPKRVPRIYIVLGAVLFAASVGASMGSTSSIGIVVDGASRHVDSGTTIADLAAAGLLAGKPGRMVSVTGHVLSQPSGSPVRTRRNGRFVSQDVTVYDGDVITSADGRNRVELLVTRRQPIAFPKRTVGSGPLATLAAPGSPGVRQLSVGAFSGDIATSTVLIAPSAMVVKHYGARTSTKIVALTFDDGPWPGQTEKILRILREQKVKASFFMIGYLVKRNPALARKVASEGHLVGNHTAGHQLLTKMTAAQIDKQLSGAERLLEADTGATVRWFRPPGGRMSPVALARVRDAGLKVAMWSVDPQDWRRGRKASQIAHGVVARVKPGSVVLMHDGGGDRAQTIRALPVIIRSLRSRGYRFVTLDEIPVQ